MKYEYIRPSLVCSDHISNLTKKEIVRIAQELPSLPKIPRLCVNAEKSVILTQISYTTEKVLLESQNS